MQMYCFHLSASNALIKKEGQAETKHAGEALESVHLLTSSLEYARSMTIASIVYNLNGPRQDGALNLMSGRLP